LAAIGQGRGVELDAGLHGLSPVTRTKGIRLAYKANGRQPGRLPPSICCQVWAGSGAGGLEPQLLEQVSVAVLCRVRRRQQLLTVEDGAGTGHEAQGLKLI